jgi:cell division protein FtsL
MRALLAVVVALLVAASFSLVTAQHRARSLFVDLERAQQQARQLDAEGDRLRIELGRASQPAAIESAARELGLKPVDGGRVVFLPAAVAAAPASAAAVAEPAKEAR